MTTPHSVYDAYWSEGGFQPPGNQNTFLERMITALCRDRVRIADLGCGDARTIGDRVSGLDVDYVGVDISSSAVASATQRGLDVRLIDDIASTGLPGGAYDVVFMIEVLEHLFDPGSAVAEAHRLLRPGGSFVVTVPNAAVWPRRMELLLAGRPNAMGDDLSRSKPWRDPHIRSFSVRSLRALLAETFPTVAVGGTEPVAPQSIGERLVEMRPTLFARRATGHAVK